MEKERKKYFIQQYSHQQYMHGGIGYVDAEKIIQAEGYEAICFPHQDDFSFRAKMNRLVYLFRIFFAIKKNSEIVFLYPVYATMNRVLLGLLSLKRVKRICFITDINGIKDGDSKQLEKDIRFFKKYQYFIVHNEKMRQWLDTVVPQNTSVSIDFFDFLVNKMAVVSNFSFDIVFAGNLEKSVFLEKLYLLQDRCPGIHFYLYGPGQTEAMSEQKNASWEGVENPYELPSKLKGGFGLLWDGDSIDKPGGSLGHYMQYISHHKLSLYIISRLPVIVPASTAAAMLIDKYKIGIAVNSLYELEEELKTITPSRYQQMQINMSRLAQQISTGGCLKAALQTIANE